MNEFGGLEGTNPLDKPSEGDTFEDDPLLDTSEPVQRDETWINRSTLLTTVNQLIGTTYSVDHEEMSLDVIKKNLADVSRQLSKSILEARGTSDLMRLIAAGLKGGEVAYSDIHKRAGVEFDPRDDFRSMPKRLDILKDVFERMRTSELSEATSIDIIHFISLSLLCNPDHNGVAGCLPDSGVGTASNGADLSGDSIGPTISHLEGIVGLDRTRDILSVIASVAFSPQAELVTA